MKQYFILLLMALAGLFCACSDDDNDSKNGNAASALTRDKRPTDWVPVSEDIDTRSSMCVDVAIDLSHLELTYKTDEQDMVAAFVNGTCRAVASANYENVEMPDSTDCVFMLTVKKLTTDDASAPVELKFYSAKLNHIFTAPKFEYVNEGIKGIITDPFKPVWEAK